jgi:hypothetical protein
MITRPGNTSQELIQLCPKSPSKVFAAIESRPALLGQYDDAETAAETVREVSSLGLNPIPDLFDVLEFHGILVIITTAVSENSFDGLQASLDSLPLVVISSQWTAERAQQEMGNKRRRLEFQELYLLKRQLLFRMSTLAKVSYEGKYKPIYSIPSKLQAEIKMTTRCL